MTTLDEIIAADFTDKNVLIIGCPAAGKTYLLNILKQKYQDHHCVHTDGYAHHGIIQALYIFMEELKTIPKKTIIEGIMGYRLLRKGVQMDCYYPDVVIQLHITDARRERTYKQERFPWKLKYLKQFDAMQAKIMHDYMGMKNDRKPEWIDVMNNY